MSKKQFPSQYDEKTEPVSADKVPLADSADADKMKYATIENLVAATAAQALSPDARTANFTLETGKIYKCSNAITCTLPLASGVSDGESVVVNMGSDVVTIETTSTDVFNGQAGFDTYQLAPGESVRINVSGGDWILN